MRTFLNLAVVLNIALLLNSCGEEPEKTKDPIKVETPESDIKSIETLFSEEKFSDPKMKELLKELNLCDEKTEDTLDYDHPSCSPKFFKFFQMNQNIPLENGFLLQIKSKVSGFPLRRLLVFVRERDQLVKANGFVGNLIGTRKTKSGYDDLLIRFNGKEQNEPVFYNCYFSWNGAKYEFSSVEVIQGLNWGGPVKAEFRDSMKTEIKQVLTDQNMFF